MLEKELSAESAVALQKSVPRWMYAPFCKLGPPVVVIGMHRSGTSLMAAILALMGTVSLSFTTHRGTPLSFILVRKATVLFPRLRECVMAMVRMKVFGSSTNASLRGPEPRGIMWILSLHCRTIRSSPRALYVSYKGQLLGYCAHSIWAQCRRAMRGHGAGKTRELPLPCAIGCNCFLMPKCCTCVVTPMRL